MNGVDAIQARSYMQPLMDCCFPAHYLGPNGTQQTLSSHCFVHGSVQQRVFDAVLAEWKMERKPRCRALPGPQQVARNCTSQHVCEQPLPRK